MIANYTVVLDWGHFDGFDRNCAWLFPTLHIAEERLLFVNRTCLRTCFIVPAVDESPRSG